MIEISTAQNGSQVARFDGRLLASAVDPQAEAVAWVARRETLLFEVDALIVLGVGCGYHIAELCRRTKADIVAIEFYPELGDLAQSIHSFSTDRVQIESLQKTKRLRQSERIRAAVTQSFLVLQHVPSQLAQATFYNDCHKQLLAREWGSLNWQWQLKGFSCLDPQTKIGNDTALTIYDLEQTELVQNSAERERMLIKALRELVK